MSTANPTPPVQHRSGGSGTKRGNASVPAPSIDPFRVLRKHTTVILASCILGSIFGAAAWISLLFLYPLYSSADTYEIVAIISDPNEVVASEQPREDVVIRLARTEMAYILSREVLTRAMQNPEVETTEWAKSLTDDSGAFMRQDAVDELEDDLVVRYIPDTNLFEVSWSAHDKRDVPIVLAAVREAYLTYREQVDEQQFSRDLTIFNEQESQINQQLTSLNQTIRGFVRDHNILTLQDLRYHPLAAEINKLNEQLADSKANLTVLASAAEQIKGKLAGTIEPTEEDRLRAEQDPTVQPLIKSMTDWRIERRRLRQSLGAGHPEISRIEELVDAAEEELEIRLDAIISRNLTGNLRDINNQMASTQKLVDDLNEQLRDKDDAMRELAGEVSEYESMLQRRDDMHEELRNTRSLTTELQRVRLRTAADRVRVATTADTPREIAFPRPEIIVPLGFLLVVGLTVGVIFLREMTDKRVKSASDLAIIPGARVLGVIPDIAEDPTRVDRAEMAVRERPRSVTAESYRQTCGPILKAMERQGHQSLLVAGGLPGSGTTTVVTNLASFIAAGGKSVLCIDANFRRPSLGRAMDCENPDGQGLGDVLCEEAYLTDVIRGCGSGIHTITAGTAASRSFERLTNGHLDKMLAELRTQYDYVLIDAPPAIVAGDAFVLANRTDASLLVVRANQEQRGLVAKLISQFNDAQSELLGIVLNRPRWTAGGYFKKNYEAMADYATNSSS